MKNKKVSYIFDDTFLNLTKQQKQNLNFLKKIFLPYTNKVYIVGGSIRNKLLNINTNSNDIDIEVHSITIELFEELMEKINANGVGKSFFVYKYENIDISLPRVESKISYGHKGFEVKLAINEKQASIRRDFTINAFMYNIFTNELLDYHNGLNDIKLKQLKVVNNISFIDDSLRVLRAIRFSCTYDLIIEKKSLYLMKSMDISDLSQSRINDELKKIFLSSYLEKAFYYMIKTDIFYKLFNYNISYLEFIKIYRYIKNKKKYFKEENYEYYFLFIIKKFLNIQIQHLNLPNRYKIISQDIYINSNISDEELMYLATFKAINLYLDALNDNIVLRAKKLDIYFKKLDIIINVQEILDKGYKNKDISLQIEKKKKEFIKKLLKLKIPILLC